MPTEPYVFDMTDDQILEAINNASASQELFQIDETMFVDWLDWPNVTWKESTMELLLLPTNLSKLDVDFSSRLFYGASHGLEYDIGIKPFEPELL